MQLHHNLNREIKNMGDAHSKAGTNSLFRVIYPWNSKRPAPPDHGNGMERRVVFQKPYFWIYRHLNAFYSCPYRYQETCAPFLPIHPSEFPLVLSLNYQESAAAALAATLYNSSVSLAIIWRRTWQQALQYLLSFGLGNGQTTVQILLNGRS